MTVKESFNVVGLSTTFGNPLWKGTSIAEPAVSSSHLTRRWSKPDSNRRLWARLLGRFRRNHFSVPRHLATVTVDRGGRATASLAEAGAAMNALLSHQYAGKIVLET